MWQEECGRKKVLRGNFCLGHPSIGRLFSSFASRDRSCLNDFRQYPELRCLTGGERIGALLGAMLVGRATLLRVEPGKK